MSESKYCHLAAVDTGEDLRVVRIESTSVYVGDMVSIDTGELGTVVAEVYININDEYYAFIAKLNPIYAATGVYRCAWTKEEPDEPA